MVACLLLQVGRLVRARFSVLLCKSLFDGFGSIDRPKNRLAELGLHINYELLS